MAYWVFLELHTCLSRSNTGINKCDKSELEVDTGVRLHDSLFGSLSLLF
jgi:hypothetical protein